MKKLALALAATAALSSAAFAQNKVSQADLVITGEITEAACSMRIKPIDFQSVSDKEFTAAGISTAWESSKIEFTSCSLDDGKGGTLNSIELDVRPGTPAPGGNNNLWMNNGTAENIGIELEVDGKSATPAGLNIQGITFKGDRDIAVRARLTSTAAAVKAGTIEAAVGIVADYK